jgi:hypothetical protein
LTVHAIEFCGNTDQVVDILNRRLLLTPFSMLFTAVQKFVEMADMGIEMLDRHHLMDTQWLSLERSRLTDDSPFLRGPTPFSRRAHRQIDSQSLDAFTIAEPSGSRIRYQEPPRTAFSVPRPVRMMTSLNPQGQEYDLSDWEDDDAMKAGELDIDSDTSDGKSFPDWASGTNLALAVARQNPNDGDIIFQTLARRCDLVQLFGTSNFEYYQKKRK